MNDSPADKLLAAPSDLDPFADDLGRLDNALSRRIDAEPESVERGLAQLVLTVIELLRQLMERQALRRVEAGGLDDETVERLGATLMALETRMEELKQMFGLRDEDLNLDLGPLGSLPSVELADGALRSAPQRLTAGPSQPSRVLAMRLQAERERSAAPPTA